MLEEEFGGPLLDVVLSGGFVFLEEGFVCCRGVVVASVVGGIFFVDINEG